MKTRINANTWLKVTGPRYVPVGNHEEYGVLVTVRRWLPYPEGTLGAEDGGVREVTVYSEFVPGSERLDPTARARVSGVIEGAYVPVPPSPEAVEAARQRALQHIDADSWADGDPRRHIWAGVGICEPEWADA